MSNNTFDRAELLRTASLVGPALAANAYIPALMHIRFDGTRATAFNDVSAVSVRCEFPASRLIPGRLLMKALGSFSNAQVLVQEGKEGELVISSGRSKVKLPTLGIETFPLEMPDDGDRDAEVELSGDILRGVEACLMSVGKATEAHPATRGVTLDADDDGNAVLYSTDRYSLTRYRTGTRIELPAGAPVVLPTFFCEQVVKLAAVYPKAEPVLLLHPGAIVAHFDRLASVLTRTPLDLQALDFPRTIARQVDVKRCEGLVTAIPPGLDEALGRSLLVLEDEVAKAAEFRVGGAEFRLLSTCQMGAADDTLQFANRSESGTFHVNPVTLARGIKVCTHMAFLERSVLLADAGARLVHLVAYVEKETAQQGEQK